jgi:hypothetical protein
MRTILLFERKIANSSNSQHGGRVFRNSSLSEKAENGEFFGANKFIKFKKDSIK